MSFVYVVGPHDPGMELPTPLIKIGKANDPDSRLRSLQTGSPQKLVFYALWKFDSPIDAMAVESACHRRFKKERKLGEWFETTCDQVKNFVQGQMSQKFWPTIQLYSPHH